MHTPVRVRGRRGGRHARPGRIGRFRRDLDQLCVGLRLLTDVQEAMGDEIERLRERVDGDEPPPGASRPPLRLVSSTREQPARRERGTGDEPPARRIS